LTPPSSTHYKLVQYNISLLYQRWIKITKWGVYENGKERRREKKIKLHLNGLFSLFQLQRYRILETRSYATVHVWFFTIVDLGPDSHPYQMFQCVIFYIGFESGDPCSTLVQEVLNNTNSCLTNISCLSVSVLLSLHL
jgi:hypothetical protein